MRRLPILLFLAAAAVLVVWTTFRRAPPAGPPGLSFRPARIDLGRLSPEAERAVEVGWRRTGRGPLRLHALVPTCGCLGAEGIPRDLSEASTGRLRVRFRAPSRPGPFRFAIRGVTDGRRHGGAALFRVPVEGWVDTPIAADPPVLDLGRSTPGRHVERSVDVRVVEALAAAPLAARLEGLAGRAIVRPPVIQGRFHVDLDLRLPPAPGRAQGTLRVRVGESAAVAVPVVSEVVAIDASAVR